MNEIRPCAETSTHSVWAVILGTATNLPFFARLLDNGIWWEGLVGIEAWASHRDDTLSLVVQHQTHGAIATVCAIVTLDTVVGEISTRLTTGGTALTVHLSGWARDFCGMKNEK